MKSKPNLTSSKIADATRTARTVRVAVRLGSRTAVEAQRARKDASEWAVIGLWKDGHVSTREAADLLGLTYYDYVDLLGTKNVPILREGLLEDGEVDQLTRDIRAGQA